MRLISLAALFMAASPPTANQLQAVEYLKNTPGMTTPPTVPVSTEVDGMTVSQSTCTSKAPIAELKTHFYGVFKKAGLYMSSEAEDWRPEKGEQVTGLDTENLLSYTAFMQPAGKMTTIVMAVTQVGMPKPDPNAPPLAPVYPGAGQVTQYKMEGMRTMTFTAPATPAQIKVFYRDTLTKAGFTERNQDLVFVRGGQELTVIVSPGVSERYVLIQLKGDGPAIAPTPMK